MGKSIPLTQGQFAIVDDEDFESVLRFKWRIAKWKNCSYAKCIVHLGYLSNPRRRIRRCMSLHQFLMRPPQGKEVDHRDRNGLNCQRKNMRICTRSQNMCNCRPHRNSTSQYKGVYWYKALRKWHSRISVAGEQIHLGYFMSEMDAALAYDNAARKYHKEFAYLNFP